MSEREEAEDDTNPPPSWAQRVGKSLATAEEFTAYEVKEIAADAVEEELRKVPLVHWHTVPETASYAERLTPRSKWEQLLAKIGVGSLKHFLGAGQER